jgi:hypothetical protein
MTTVSQTVADALSRQAELTAPAITNLAEQRDGLELSSNLWRDKRSVATLQNSEQQIHFQH